MVDNISWQSYWYTIAIILAGYYLVIYLLYFRRDFSIKFRGKDHDVAENANGRASSITNNEPGSKQGEEYLFNACLNELSAFFEEAKHATWIKEELFNSLQRLFKKYSSLKTSDFYTLLNHIVVGQCESYCSIHLDAEDMRRVWLE